MDRQELAQKWQDFMEVYEYDNKAIAVAEAFPNDRSLWVEYEHIDNWDSDFLDYVLKNPAWSFRVAEDSILENLPVDLKERVEAYHLPIHFRIKGTPKDKMVIIRNIRHEHVGKFVGIDGLVRRATEVRPRLVSGAFQCTRCGYVTRIKQEGLKFMEPQFCDPDQGGCGKSINQTSFKLLVDKSVFIDDQYLEVQEEVEGARGGAQPQSLSIVLEDDLVGTALPGDRVRINGILAATQRRRGSEKITKFEIHLDGISVERDKTDYDAIQFSDEEKEMIKELSTDPDVSIRIRDSIAPQIYGYTEVKDALALQLFGGVEKIQGGGTKLRGDIHILLIGDPGTAKSQLLGQIAKIAPRGRYASGKSASAAGLTAAAVKDEGTDGRWTLEAGVLVLADRGTACVDEMDKMSAQDRSSMHEAMEQQTVTVAKAGINATLRSRCSMLGAANPKKGRFDEFSTPVDQIEMPPTLLSRFDLIFPMTDKPGDNDGSIAEHILSVHEVGAAMAQKAHHSLPAEIDPDILERKINIIRPAIPTEFLRKYVAFAKEECNPILTTEAKGRIKEFYLGIRKKGEASGSAVPITARQLEAIVRLSEASARMHLSPVVRAEDVDRAVGIMQYYLIKLASDGSGGFDMDRVMSDYSHKQRSAAVELRNIIVELIRSEPDGAPLEKILNEAESRQFDRMEAQRTLDKLSENGEVYKGRGNKYRLPGGR